MSNTTEPAERPLSVQDAVRAAVRALPSYLGQEGTPVAGVRVEEVFPPNEENNFWRITVSHLEQGVERPKPEMQRMVEQAMRTATEPAPERVYQVLRIHPTIGDVLGMSLRDAPFARST